MTSEPSAGGTAESAAVGGAGGRDAVPLGDVAPAGSRHAGRRSGVALVDGVAVVGTADGALRAVDTDSSDALWTADGDAPPVSLTGFDGGDADAVAVGERGPDGAIRLHDRETGERRWTFETVADLGSATRETRYDYPFVVAFATDRGRLFAAARRYERDGDARRFRSVVYAFDPRGGIAWRYEADASPIALDADGGRLAVAYNRCPGDHADGLVVLDADDGAERWRWDPGGDGARRVGDVDLLPEGAVVASHADYRGYRLDAGGAVEWRVDLGRPVERGSDRVYAYPNHVRATTEGAAFVTGNTYPTEGRETDERHPNENAAVGVAPDGERRWTAAVGGFAATVAGTGRRIAVPVAQAFRDRVPERHGLRAFDVASGSVGARRTEGVAAAAAVGPGVTAVVEEPVRYHDDGETRGSYRLHLFENE